MNRPKAWIRSPGTQYKLTFAICANALAPALFLTVSLIIACIVRTRECFMGIARY